MIFVLLSSYMWMTGSNCMKPVVSSWCLNWLNLCIFEDLTVKVIRVPLIHSVVSQLSKHVSSVSSHSQEWSRNNIRIIVVVVQSLNCVRHFVTPWIAAHRVLCHRLSASWLKCMSIESVMQSNHLILWCPFLLLPSIFPSSWVFSNDRLFTSGGQSIGASIQYQSSNEYSELISLGLTGLISFCPRDSQESSAAQKHHNLKTSILWGSAFFMVQLLHP